jgi:hypothetical protein
MARQDSYIVQAFIAGRGAALKAEMPITCRSADEALRMIGLKTGASKMPSHIRYGRRIQIPSSVQLRHELKAFIAQENVRELCAEAEGLPLRATWKEIEAQRRALSGSPASR